jgi:hypothetical protein
MKHRNQLFLILHEFNPAEELERLIQLRELILQHISQGQEE